MTANSPTDQSAPSAAPLGDDAILPFQLDHLDLRGRIIRLDQTLDTILGQHAYPPTVCALVGEAAILTAMIGQAMKLRGRFSMQVRGDGDITLIATDFYPPQNPDEPARLRAYARFRDDALEVAQNPFHLFGRGVFGMIIDQGANMHPYQGVVPLAGGSLAACAETYFAQSEQIATRFHIGLGQAHEPGAPLRWRGGGIMLQHLPDYGEGMAQRQEAQDGGSGEEGLLTPQDVAEWSDKGEDWTNAMAKIDSIELTELIGPHVSPKTLLWRLFHEDEPRIYDPQTVAFGCTCSRDKVLGVLSGFPKSERAEMIAETGKVEVDCQFCGAVYHFSPEEIGDGTDE
ncbi:MAG: Hsp33 family molecular chaperone HslO [Neomegalonema sp.]|nr:Hsp33 family molecular chaperone HslO [Neomegalonema sp.]